MEGRALIGRTRVHGRTCLKFTLLNPHVGLGDIEQLLRDVKSWAPHAL